MLSQISTAARSNMKNRISQKFGAKCGFPIAGEGSLLSFHYNS